LSLLFIKYLINISFQAYLDNIQTKTGKSPDDFKATAEQKGFTQSDKLKSTTKAGDTIIHLGTVMLWLFMRAA
jgi:hypothetical protein